MPFRTQIESDGKTVYVLSRSHSGGGGLWLLGQVVLWFLVVGLFGWVLLELTQERGGLLLIFLLVRFAAYPVLRRISRNLIVEEVELSTTQLVSQRTYGFIRGPRYTFPYHEGQLATGAEPINKSESLFEVAWFTDSVNPARKPRMIHRHYFPMSSADYETIKTYVQELFDLDASEDFELLFSAN